MYYTITVDYTLLVALGDLASMQTKDTKHTLVKLIWLINYCATHPDAEITYVTSDMCLHAHIDASFLSVINVRSRAGRHFFLSSKYLPEKSPALCPINGPIHVILKIMKIVMGSAAESEIGAGFMTAQDIIPMRTYLLEMGHPQPPTII